MLSEAKCKAKLGNSSLVLTAQIQSLRHDHWLCLKWRITLTQTNPAPILSMECVHTVHYAHFERNAQMFTQSALISDYGAELDSHTAPQCIAHF